MAYIKVDFSRLARLEGDFANTARSIQSVADDVENVRNGLDWRVAIQEHTDSTLKNISRELEEIRKSFESVVKFLEYAEKEYKDAESMTPDEIVARNRQLTYDEAKRRQIDYAMQKAVSTDDAAMVYLRQQREKNESFLLQLASYGYSIATFDAVGLVKKIVPGSSEVNVLRKEAMQTAFSTILNKSAAAEVTESDLETVDDVMSMFLDEGGMLDGVYKEATGNDSGLGKTVTVAKFLWDTGMDFHEYNEWSDEQKRLFGENLLDVVQTRQLLEEIKTVYANDDLLVSYCDECIQEIDSQKKNILQNLMDDAANYGGIVVKNAAEAGASYGAGYLIGNVLGINPVSIAGQATGLGAEVFAGTKTTNETFEYMDILHTKIEESSANHAAAVNQGNVSEEVLLFHELYMLNMKMEGLELSKDLNKVLFEQRNTEFVADVDSMVSSYQNAYDTLAAQ